MDSAAEGSTCAARVARPSIAAIARGNNSVRATPAIEKVKKSPDRRHAPPPKRLRLAATGFVFIKSSVGKLCAVSTEHGSVAPRTHSFVVGVEPRRRAKART